MNRLLVPGAADVGERVTADEATSHHLLGVQRVARGGAVRVSDGRGWSADAQLVDVVGGRAVLEIRAVVVQVAVPERVILLGMPKPAALEEALVLGTEAGATRFVLVRAARSPPGELRADRIERVLRAAVTQCGRSALPVVDGPVALEQFAVNELPGAVEARFIATGGGAGLAGADLARRVWIAVGPEGGWDPAEQQWLEGCGFAPLGLGPHILRTPTAVAVALGRTCGG